MTVTPDPSEFVAPRGNATLGGPRLMSGGFWVMMGLGLVSILAAGAVVMIAPRFAPAHSAHPPAPALAPAPARVATTDLPPIPAAQAAAASSGEVVALQDRVRRLEEGQDRALAAAAEALAASGLSDAAAQPRPFADTLSAYQRVLPTSAATAGLRALALQGAPTRAALAADLGQIASRLSMEARAPRKGAEFLDQIAYAVSRVVSIRRLDPAGADADAVIARAQRLAEEGDLSAALAALDAGLPASARPALQAWREQALRRIAIDEALAGLRAEAVADLALARGIRP